MAMDRLTKKQDFQRLFKRGQRARSNLFGLVYLVNITNQKPRVAIIIKASLISKSTKRNYWRRRIREVIRLEIAKFNQKLDLAIILSKVPPKGFKFTDLKSELLSLFQRISNIYYHES